MNTRGGSQAARILTAAKDGGASVPPKSRKSLAPSAMGYDPRASLAGGHDPRRSSTFGAKPSGPKADPRPLSDKAFLNDCVRTVITYLSTHGYPAAVSPKTLASPTGKDFTLIAQFLFQRFDPSMKTFGKMEDEVQAFFKRLNYPFTISKSALFAVGSPHSWPAVLAALTWLVELLNYHAKAEEAAGPGAGAMHTHARPMQRHAGCRELSDACVRAMHARHGMCISVSAAASGPLPHATTRAPRRAPHSAYTRETLNHYYQQARSTPRRASPRRSSSCSSPRRTSACGTVV